MKRIILWVVVALLVFSVVANVFLVNMNLHYKGLADRSTELNDFPLGIASLTACLEEKGFSVDFRDYQTELNSRKVLCLDKVNSFLRNSSGP